jgi:hypothetical protein
MRSWSPRDFRNDGILTCCNSTCFKRSRYACVESDSDGRMNRSTKKGTINANNGISTANPGNMRVFHVIMLFKMSGLLFKNAPNESGFHKTCDTESAMRESFTCKLSSRTGVFNVCNSDCIDAHTAGSPRSARRGS